MRSKKIFASTNYVLYWGIVAVVLVAISFVTRLSSAQVNPGQIGIQVETYTIDSDDTIKIPIDVLVEGSNLLVSTVEIDLIYDETVITVDECTLSPQLSGGCNIDTPGKIEISGFNPTGLGNDFTMALLDLRAIGTAGGSSPLTITVIDLANESSDPIDDAVISDGEITINGRDNGGETGYPAPTPNANSEPMQTNPGNQLNSVGDAVDFTVSATDTDGDTLTYSASGLPNGVTLNSENGQLSGSPTEPGDYDVTIAVDDGNGGSSSESFVWTITTQPDIPANTEPEITNPGDQNNTVGEAIDLSLTATDPDGDALSLSAVGLPDGILLNSAESRLSGSPTLSGTYSVTITADDGNGGIGTTSFGWTIADAPEEPVNFAPVITNPGDQNSTLGDVVSLQIEASDSEGDAISFSASGLPDGLAIESGSGLISGSPATAGTFEVTLTANDGKVIGVEERFSWTVTEAQLPIEDVVLKLDDYTVAVGETFDVPIRFLVDGTNQNVASAALTLLYDSTLLVAESCTLEGELSGSCVTDLAGEVSIVGDSPVALENDFTLVTIRFRVISTGEATTTLTISAADLIDLFDAPVEVTFVDGRIEIYCPQQ